MNDSDRQLLLAVSGLLHYPEDDFFVQARSFEELCDLLSVVRGVPAAGVHPVGPLERPFQIARRARRHFRHGQQVQPVPCMAPLRGRSPAWARAGGPERIVPRRGL